MVVLVGVGVVKSLQQIKEKNYTEYNADNNTAIKL